MLPDHFAPNKDIKSAQQCKELREFAKEQDLTHYYEVGKVGIEHCFLPEQGIVGPGELIIGADSHTCTYGALGAFSTGVEHRRGCGYGYRGNLVRVPSTIKVNIVGQPSNPWVSGRMLS